MGTGATMIGCLRCRIRERYGEQVRSTLKVSCLWARLRHANSRITLDIYTQAVTSNKRDAQSKVVRMMVPDAGTKKPNVGTMDFEKIAEMHDKRLLSPYRARISLSLRSQTPHKSIGMYGGDDGARTRDLCRDRAAL